jgi:hypothetical protein
VGDLPGVRDRGLAGGNAGIHITIAAQHPAADPA